MASPFEIVCGVIAALVLGAWAVGLFRYLTSHGITPVRVLIVLGVAVLIWG